MIKAPDRHAKRLSVQVEVQYTEEDAVWVYLFFRVRRGEKKMKKWACSWHCPYRVVGQVGENAYRVTISTHSDKVVTLNVNWLKQFRGRRSRPDTVEVSVGAKNDVGSGDAGPLEEDDLPSTSVVERLYIGGEEIVFAGVGSPNVDIVVKRIKSR